METDKMKKLLKALLIVLCVMVLFGCANKKEEAAEPQQETAEPQQEAADTQVPKDQQEGTAGSNIPLKDNLEEAKYQIEVAMQYQLEKMYGDKVNDARIYVEKMYSAEEEKNIPALQNLGPNEIAFEVKYELHPSEGTDVNELTAASGVYDEASGWVKDKFNVGILRPNSEASDPKYVITDLGTGF